MLRNSKVGSTVYQLDLLHVLLQPEFEENTVMKDPSHPTSAMSHAEIEAEADRVANDPLLKTKSDQMTYLVGASHMFEQGLSDLVKNQEILERIMEMKFHTLEVKVTELTATVASLKKEVDVSSLSSDDNGTTLPMTQFTTMPRSSILPAPETRPSLSAPVATTTVPPSSPLVSTPPA
ncbi:Aspartic proteinase nepenthesin-1 [Hordeum vulgare]|nr:Aspartic proteinase nepenthesin-1 [Hordeum vulgare]